MQQPTEIYFDDSGDAGVGLDDVQCSMFIAGVVLRHDNRQSIACALDQVRHKASQLSGFDDFELKASHIYVGSKSFTHVALRDRAELLEMLVDVLLGNGVQVLWQGIPKWMAKEKGRKDAWRATLLGYCALLHDHVFRHGAGHGSVIVCGDASTWVEPEMVLVPPTEYPWPCFFDGAVCFRDSATPGLQLADLAAHTLCLANKARVQDRRRSQPVLSYMDEVAVRLYTTLAERDLWVCL